jgi:hypothetical protein
MSDVLLYSKILLNCPSHDNLVVFYYITVHLTSGLIRVVASNERDNLVVFYYITEHLTSGLIRWVASHERVI